MTEIILVSAATSLALMLFRDGGSTKTPCRAEHHWPSPTKAAHERWRRYQRQQRRCSARSSPRLPAAQSASRRHRLREMHHNTFRRRRREEEYAGRRGEMDQHKTSIRRRSQAGATPPWMCKEGIHLPTALGMPLRGSVQTLRIEGRGICTNRDRSDGHAGKGAHERPRRCNWIIQAQVQLSDEWPGLGVDTYADRFDRGQNRGGHPERNGILWGAQGRGANFRCNATTIGGRETTVDMDQGTTQKDREGERQGEGQGKAERRRRVHELRKNIGVKQPFQRLCASYSRVPSFTNWLFACFFHDRSLAVGNFALRFGSSRCSFLALLCWQNDAYLITLLVYMYLAFGVRGRYTQDKNYSNGACRSKNLQCGASAGRPGAVGCLGQRRTGGRPWPGHGGHGPHSFHDMLMVKETGRLCSPAVGAVLRRCKALARRRYFYGLSQLRRSGGPWFCCSLALRSCVMLPWSDLAFPQVIESDLSTTLAETAAT